MTKETAIKLFQDQRVRVHWDNDQEKWYFSIIDVIGVLTGSERPRKYWSDLKSKLKSEGSEVSEKIGQLKMKSSDGKMRATDVADTEQLLRLIQSIPSPKAEPFKLWLAKVGYERIEETEDPEKAFDRAMETYLKKGYSVNWINQRLKSIEVRKELTDEWDSKGVKKGLEYAILTDEITKAWDKLIKLGVNEETINVVTRINGYNLESLESILYAVFGYRSFDQVTIKEI
jgi:prophage antirepressor-like protein